MLALICGKIFLCVYLLDSAICGVNAGHREHKLSKGHKISLHVQKDKNPIRRINFAPAIVAPRVINIEFKRKRKYIIKCCAAYRTCDVQSYGKANVTNSKRDRTPPNKAVKSTPRIKGGTTLSLTNEESGSLSTSQDAKSKDSNSAAKPLSPGEEGAEEELVEEPAKIGGSAESIGSLAGPGSVESGAGQGGEGGASVAAGRVGGASVAAGGEGGASVAAGGVGTAPVVEGGSKTAAGGVASTGEGGIAGASTRTGVTGGVGDGTTAGSVSSTGSGMGTVGGASTSGSTLGSASSIGSGSSTDSTTTSGTNGSSGTNGTSGLDLTTNSTVTSSSTNSTTITTKANWTENHDVCCSLGMYPFYLANGTDGKCFQDFVTSFWNYNYNYWSAGIKNATTLASWCPLNNSQPGEGINWATNKTDMFDCTRMKIGTKNSKNPLKTMWDYRNCSAKFIIACKAPVTTEPPPICQEKSRKYALFTGPNSTLKDPSKYGNWFRAFNLTFLFGLKKNWTAALTQCGELGMKLISFDQLKFVDYIRTLTKNNSFLSNKTFWSSGYDKDGPGKYSWCTKDNAPVTELNWKEGKVGSTAGCLMVFYPKIPETNDTTNPPDSAEQSAYKGYFSVEDCTTMNFYICVAAVMPNPMNHQKDCMAAFGVTQGITPIFCLPPSCNLSADIDAILTMPTYTEAMKCFIRCMGENLKYLYGDSTLIDENIIRMIELTATDDQTLEKQLDIYDVCRKEHDPEPCTKAAKVFRCGVDREPAGMTSLITGGSTQAGKDNQLENIIGPFPAACPVVSGCTSDPAFVSRRAAWSTETPQNSFSSYFIQACGRIYYLARGSLAPGMNAAQQYCCKFGMSLAKIETFEELMCIADVNTAIVSAYKIQYGQFRLFGSNDGSLDFSVWCPANTPIDMSMFFVTARSTGEEGPSQWAQ